MIIVFTFCWSVKGGQGPSGPALPCRSPGRRPGVDSGLGLRCLVSVGGEVSGVAYVVDEVGVCDVRPGVVCGVVEGLGVHLRFPFRLVTTALCLGARRGVNGTRGGPAGVAWTVDVPACAVAWCAKEPIGRENEDGRRDPGHVIVPAWLDGCRLHPGSWMARQATAYGCGRAGWWGRLMSIASRTGFVGPSRMAGTSTPVSNCPDRDGCMFPRPRLWPASVASLPGFWRIWIRRSAVFDGRHPFLSGMRRRGLRLMDGPARLFRCGFPITRRRVWCHGRRCRPCGWCVSPRV